jgi:hypothetical protein
VKREELLQRVRQAVRKVEPEADIILYGSHARGDAQAESDWDFLILLDGAVDEAHRCCMPSSVRDCVGIWRSPLLQRAKSSGMGLALAPGNPVGEEHRGARNPPVTEPRTHRAPFPSRQNCVIVALIREGTLIQRRVIP